MTFWSEVFLGVIAAATLAMAIVLVSVLVAAGLVARRLGRLLDDIDAELKPVFEHLNAISRDASRAAFLASAQVERVDQLFADVAYRVDERIQGLLGAVTGPAREGRALLSALIAGFRAVRDARTRGSRAEEDDALFI